MAYRSPVRRGGDLSATAAAALIVLLAGCGGDGGSVDRAHRGAATGDDARAGSPHAEARRTGAKATSARPRSGPSAGSRLQPAARTKRLRSCLREAPEAPGLARCLGLAPPRTSPPQRRSEAAARVQGCIEVANAGPDLARCLGVPSGDESPGAPQRRPPAERVQECLQVATSGPELERCANRGRASPSD